MNKFGRLNISDKKLVLQAWSLVMAIRVGLWILRFRRLYPYVQRLTRRPPGKRVVGVPSERIVWAIMVSSRYVPRGHNCLCRALAAYYLLLRNGHHAIVRFGVTRDAKQMLKAHAWVESGGVPIIGQKELDHFTPLTERSVISS